MSQVRIKLFQHISHPKNIPEAKNIPGQEAENNWIKDLKEPSSNQCISGNLCNSYLILQFSSVQLSSVTQLCPTLRNPMNLRMPGLPVHHQLPEFTQIHVHWVSDAIQSPHPLSSPSPPALNLSQHQGLFKWAALHISWPKYWSFSLNISLSNEHPGLISFRMDWLDLLAFQGTLNSLPQHHSSKA